MLAVFKRYSIALFFLLLVAGLMILGTMGVKQFGDKMLESTDTQMKPRGEKVNL